MLGPLLSRKAEVEVVPEAEAVWYSLLSARVE